MENGAPAIRQKLAPFIKSAAGQHGISGGDLKSVLLPVPPLSAQQEIVRRIQTAFTWLDRGAEHANASRLLSKLDQAILAKAFRGELVLPEWLGNKQAQSRSAS
jgi:type I restriction enzyme S subunit